MNWTTEPRTPVYIDAGVFLGMHSQDEGIRVASKNAVIEHQRKGIVMTMDQIGLCDAVVWRRPRATQDVYYPFMDQLHSMASIHRVCFEADDLEAAYTAHPLASLPVHSRLLLAQVTRVGTILYSWDARLTRRTTLPVRLPPSADKEALFPDAIEDAYQRSLGLRLSSFDEIYVYAAHA